MWLKIKVWTKIVVASALGLYALIFIIKNTSQQVKFWWWFGREENASVLLLTAVAFVVGVLVAVLVRTTWKTVTQIRELQRRARQQRNERDLAEMKSKAGMLRTRPTAADAAVATEPTRPFDEVPSSAARPED
jgi:uncharacterized integral membrane protein